VNNIIDYMELFIEEILELVKKKMQEQGAYTRDAYKQFVEETIDYFIEKGKLTDDDNLEFIEDKLMDMYEEISNEFAE
jgi:polyhydroxyalkanoate synthesis regulator phasin